MQRGCSGPGSWSLGLGLPRHAPLAPSSDPQISQRQNKRRVSAVGGGLGLQGTLLGLSLPSRCRLCPSTGGPPGQDM